MNDSTRNEIMDIISELRDTKLKVPVISDLRNMMSGLFDGYLYSNIQLYALELPTNIASRIMKVYATCNRYDKLETLKN
jgi:hypothetical protein